ncbi:hypothetical protein [Streptomyces sp. NPDC051211]|uniref:hypothetical protein n=1 Tax=Streptomyces sp. NPDC051211 TaxID=3154643 RepID=UPI00345080F7
MHTPSRPEDLAPPRLLWARAVTLALLEVGCWESEEYAVDEDGLWCHSTGAGGWWRLTLFDGGERAVFVGQDPDGSHTHIGGKQIDFLAGGPDWLPWELLRDDAAGNLFGFVYWWEDGAWHRIPYPAELREDGLDMAAPWVGSDEGFRESASSPDPLSGEQEALHGAEVVRFAALAEAGTVTEADVAALLTTGRAEGYADPRPAEAVALAARAGVLAGRASASV